MSDAQSSWVDEFQAVFWTAKRAMTDAADAAYRRHGVRGGQQFILMCLWETDGLSPGEIARRLGLATPTVTKATSRMESAGLVRREPHPRDARLVGIHLTDRGRELQAVLGEEMHQLSQRALRSMGERDRERFVGYLSDLRRNVSGTADQADATG